LAYTAYRTWTTGEIVTAALMDEQVRDNGLLTAPAIMTGAGDLIYSSAANTPVRLPKDTNSTRVLTNTGTSNVPAWAQVTLTSGVTGTLPVANGGTNLTSLGSGVATFMGTPSSANLRGALTDETGTGSAVFATSPTLVTPALGTPGSGVLTSCTGLPEAGLAVSNGPTNGYMLTAQSGDAGGMTWAAVSSGLSAASEAEMVAASSTTVAATPGRTQNHPGVAKAWGRMGSDGTIITGAYNITSTKNSTGVYTWTLTTTDFADTNWIATMLATSQTSASQSAAGAFNADTLVTKNFNSNSDETVEDAGASIVCFGLQ
jgi:hypothetical protein